MKRTLLVMTGLLVACCAFGRPLASLIEVPTITKTNGAASIQLSAYVDEVLFVPPTNAGVSATMVLVAAPKYGGATVLATNTVTANTTIRPRLDGTAISGSGLTSDPPDRYMAAQETLTAYVAEASATGLIWRVWIKYDDTK